MITAIKNIPFKTILQRFLVGYVIGLLIISLFIFTVDNPDPTWGKYWRIRPLIITPIAVGLGMFAFFLKDVLPPPNKWILALIYVMSTLMFVIALWLGIVLGLDGTLWN